MSVTFKRQGGTIKLMLMNPNKNRSAEKVLDDAALVAASIQGDRQAFGKIVTRYQRLLCSLAYSSVGNLSESEDVAQEAFVVAKFENPLPLCQNRLSPDIQGTGVIKAIIFQPAHGQFSTSHCLGHGTK